MDTFLGQFPCRGGIVFKDLFNYWREGERMWGGARGEGERNFQ